MRLAPRIIQAMEILQLPVMALQERIDRELQSNPVLEMWDPGVDPEQPPAREEESTDRGEEQMVVNSDDGNTRDFERLAEYVDAYGTEFVTSDAPFRPRPAGGERDRKMDAMANTPAPVQSLNEYLLEQWVFVEASDEVQVAGRLIVNYIDDDGYLRTPLEELPQKTRDPVTEAQLRDALKLVQTLDPIGVGARDLRECLTIQLNTESAAVIDLTLELELVYRFLRDIEMKRLPHIERKTGKTVEQVKEAIANLSRLTPHPGTLIGQRTVPGIFPDVMVELTDDGEMKVFAVDGRTPRLYISRSYRRMARDRNATKETRSFLRDNIRSAEWLIGAIQQRRNTVERVTKEVFEVQRDFLDDGAEALKPLPMADVARKVGVHVATVSRADAAKYVKTPRGIYPLRMIFSGGTTTAEGQDMSWDAVRVKLKEIIDSEDKSKPLNDDQLAVELKNHGIKIARRTVAKYRNLMNIPRARKRKQY